MANKGDLFESILTIGAVGGGLLFTALKNHKRVRKIVDTPRSKVASAPQGFVELEGFAWPQGETFKTINGEEAVYYTLELQREESRGSGKNRRTVWVTAFKVEHILPFYLLDPTGIAVINPLNSEVSTKENCFAFSNLSKPSKERLTELVGDAVQMPNSSGFWSKLTASNYRIKERKVIAGSPLYAMGDFTTHGHNQLTIDDALSTFANKVIDFNSRSLRNITSIIDQDNDGKISHQEAIAGYTAAASISRRNPSTQSAPLQVCGALLSSENHKLFFADTHEHHLVETLGRWQKLRLIGGAALLAISIGWGSYELNFDKWLLVLGPHPSPQEVELASTGDKINKLHDGCIYGRRADCRLLLRQRIELNLSPEHIRYYEQKSK